jgi:hypothetical protein
MEHIEQPETTTTTTHTINRGAGAGGANTNKNGLSYEDLTDLSSNYMEIGTINSGKHKYKSVRFEPCEHIYINVNKSKLHSYMDFIQEKDKTIIPAAGCKEPDEAYVENNTKNIFIIEKKFQQGPGSVDEKIQTCLFKKIHYSKLFPNYKIHYIYCLSEWFKKDEYISVIEYMKENGIPIFWGNDEHYKKNIIEYMISNSV